MAILKEFCMSFIGENWESMVASFRIAWDPGGVYNDRGVRSQRSLNASDNIPRVSILNSWVTTAS